MTRGPVSLKIVGDRLALARQCLADLETLAALGREAFESDRRNPAAADSFLRRAIEALFDAARHVLARRHGLAGLDTARSPGWRSSTESSPTATWRQRS